MNEGPHSPNIGLDAALSQLSCQLPQGERAGANALAQPLGVDARQSPLLAAANLARSDASGLLSQALPFADAGSADPKRLRDRSNRLACISTARTRSRISSE